MQDPQDRAIVNGDMNLIYCWHNSVPTMEGGVPVLRQHSKEGQAFL